MITNISIPLKTSFLDYADPEHECVEVFMMGCDNSCKNCQNVKFKDTEYSTNTRALSVTELLVEIDKLAKRIQSNKVVLSGGDPISTNNRSFTKELIKDSRFDFMIYTGHSIEVVKDFGIIGFTFIKCGCYDEDLKQTSEKTDDYIRFSSTNQKLYDRNYNLVSENGTYYFKEQHLYV